MSNSKVFKKSFAVVMMLVMMVSFAFVSSPSAFAASSKKVTVKKVAVTNLTDKVLYVAKGKTVSIKTNVTVTPNKAANKKVAYKTANKKVATVSSKGKVKGVKLGSTKITVTSKANSKKKTTIKVQVTNPVKKVYLSKTQATLKLGEKTTLKAVVNPTKNACKALKLASSNKKVATVDAKGNVVAKAVGVANITATAVDGTGKKAVCKVTVVNPVSIASANIENAGNKPRSYKIKVVLNQAKVLTKADFSVKEKVCADGAYKKSIKIDSIYTTDNKTYLVELQEVMVRGCYYLVTVNSLDGQKNVELFFKLNGDKSKQTVYGLVGQSLSNSIDVSSTNGYYSLSIVSGTLPAGLKFDSEKNAVYGTPTAVANNQLVVFKAVDELGSEFTVNVNFVIADEKTIVANNSVFGDISKLYKNTGDEFVYISAIGGSGQYNCSLVNNYNGAFSIDDGGEDDFVIHFDTDNLKEKEYNLQAVFKDVNNPELTTTANIKIIITETYKMTVTLDNAKGAELSFFNNTTGEFFGLQRIVDYSADSDKYVLEYYIPAGNYEIYAFDAFENITVFTDDLIINGDKSFTYSMPSANKVNISVLDSKGVELKNDYRVVLEQKEVDSTGSSAVYEQFNDKENSFSFKNIPNGEYRVIVMTYDKVEDDYTEIYTSEYFNVKGNSNLQFKIRNYTIDK